MICPQCNTSIPDDAQVCPACHADLSVTRVMPRLRGSWCSSCGALVPEGATACPKCSTPLQVTTSAKRLSVKLPEIDKVASQQEDAGTTNVMPRIESALPAEPDLQEEALYGREHLPKTRTFLLAAFASLVIVGGGIILITHPWDPTLTDTRATTAADVSWAGYPGEVNRLTGQDRDATTQEVVSADEQTFSDLSVAYTQLSELSGRADELEVQLDKDAISASAEIRQAAYESAQTLSLDVSNLASDISEIEVATTGTYKEDKEHLSTLVSWLRNRIEAIEKSWERSSKSADPVADAANIMAPMQGNRATDGSEAYVNLFSSNYELWEPIEK